MKFTFGKYKGRDVEEVMEYNPSYCLWAHKNVVEFNLSAEQVKICEDNLKHIKGNDDNTISW